MPAEGTYDVIVVGAGIAGSAAATTFARQHRKVLLLERKLREPDRIVGELLQPGGVAALQQLGLGNCVEGIDETPVHGYHIYWKTEEITFWYPQLAGQSKKPQGKSFHHGRFVSKLRQAALDQDGVTVLESTVTSLITNKTAGTIVGVETQNGEKQKRSFYASLTIIADGSSSNLRSQFRTHRPVAKSRFWGLELQGVELPVAQLAYGVIGSGPPVLLYQIGTNETRILIDIPTLTQRSISASGDVESYIRSSVIPALPKAIQSQVEDALQHGQLRSMPNQWFPPKTNTSAGSILLGDAANMRHPLTGGGMTVALRDVALLRDLLQPNRMSLDDQQAVLQAMREFHWKRKKYSASLNILAQALYTLFVADDPDIEIMQRGFVQYIRKGGRYVDEPAGFLGGVIGNPFLLVFHFFSVALYSMWLYACSSPLIYLPYTLVRCVLVFYRAAGMILPYILCELWV